MDPTKVKQSVTDQTPSSVDTPSQTQTSVPASDVVSQVDDLQGSVPKTQPRATVNPSPMGSTASPLAGDDVTDETEDVSGTMISNDAPAPVAPMGATFDSSSDEVEDTAAGGVVSGGVSPASSAAQTTVGSSGVIDEDSDETVEPTLGGAATATSSSDEDDTPTGGGVASV